MPTIELGERGAEPRHDPAGPGTTSRSRRRRGVPPARLVAVLIGLLGTMAAGAPWPAPLPEAGITARLGARVFAAGDWLFVVSPAGADGRARQLAGYRLPEREPRWQRALPSGVVVEPTLLGETLVLVMYPEPPAPEWGRTTVLDVTTGEVSWERGATPQAVSSTGDLILWVPAPGWRPGPDNGTPPATLEAVNRVSGQVRWSLPLPAGVRSGYEQSRSTGAPTVVLTWASGRVEVRDLGTAAVTRAIELPPPGSGSETGWAGEVVGDLFLVHEPDAVTAYGLTGLERRWSIATDGDAEYGASSCGAELCSFHRNGGVRVLDPRTGTLRWTDPRWTELLQAGGVFIASGLTGSGPRYAVDPQTGRVLAELGVWEAVDAGHPNARFLGVRIGRDRRAWVAEFDAGALRMRVLAVLDGVSGDCGLAGRTLYCRRVDASIGLWQLPG